MAMEISHSLAQKPSLPASMASPRKREIGDRRRRSTRQEPQDKKTQRRNEMQLLEVFEDDPELERVRAERSRSGHQVQETVEEEDEKYTRRPVHELVQLEDPPLGEPDVDQKYRFGAFVRNQDDLDESLMAIKPSDLRSYKQVLLDEEREDEIRRGWDPIRDPVAPILPDLPEVKQRAEPEPGIPMIPLPDLVPEIKLQPLIPPRQPEIKQRPKQPLAPPRQPKMKRPVPEIKQRPKQPLIPLRQPKIKRSSIPPRRIEPEIKRERGSVSTEHTLSSDTKTSIPTNRIKARQSDIEPPFSPLPPFFTLSDTEEFLGSSTPFFDSPVGEKWNQLPRLDAKTFSSEYELRSIYLFVYVGEFQLVSEVIHRATSTRKWLSMFWIDALERNDNIFTIATLSAIVANRRLARYRFFPNLNHLYATDEQNWVQVVIESKDKRPTTSQCYYSSRLHHMMKSTQSGLNRRMILLLSDACEASTFPMAALMDPERKTPPLRAGEFRAWLKPVLHAFCFVNEKRGKVGNILHDVISIGQCHAFAKDVRARWCNPSVQTDFIYKPKIAAILGCTLFTSSFNQIAMEAGHYDLVEGCRYYLRPFTIKKEDSTIKEKGSLRTRLFGWKPPPVELKFSIEQIAELQQSADTQDNIQFQKEPSGESKDAARLLDEYERLFFGGIDVRDLGLSIGIPRDTDATLEMLHYLVYPHVMYTYPQYFEAKLRIYEKSTGQRYRPREMPHFRHWEPLLHLVYHEPSDSWRMAFFYDMSRYHRDPYVRQQVMDRIRGDAIEYALSSTEHQSSKRKGPLRSFLDPSILLDETDYIWINGSPSELSYSVRAPAHTQAWGVENPFGQTFAPVLQGQGVVYAQDPAMMQHVSDLSIALEYLLRGAPDIDLKTMVNHLVDITIKKVIQVMFWCAEMKVHSKLDQKGWIWLPDITHHANLLLFIPQEGKQSKLGMERILSLTERNVCLRHLVFTWTARRDEKRLVHEWKKWIQFIVLEAVLTLHITTSPSMSAYLERRTDLTPVMRSYLAVCSDVSYRYRFHTSNRIVPRLLQSIVAGGDLLTAKLGEGAYGIVYRSNERERVLKLAKKPVEPDGGTEDYEEARLGMIAGEAGIGPHIYDLELVRWVPHTLPKEVSYTNLQNQGSGLVIQMDLLHSMENLFHSVDFHFGKGLKRKEMFLAMLESFRKCVFYHLRRGDPNPANYAIASLGDEKARPKLHFIDFGLFSTMELPFRPDFSSFTGYQVGLVMQNAFTRFGHFSMDIF